MYVTQAHDVIYIGFVGFRRQRIPEENNKIDIIMFNLGSNLLFPAQMTG